MSRVHMFAGGRRRKEGYGAPRSPGLDSISLLESLGELTNMHRSMRARFAPFATILLSCSLVMASCSGNGSTNGTATGNTVKIGADLPVSGADASDGVPTQNGVKMAVIDANAQNMAPGFTFQADLLDDAVNGVHDPGQGAKNIQALASDPTVIGVD